MSLNPGKFIYPYSFEETRAEPSHPPKNTPQLTAISPTTVDIPLHAPTPLRPPPKSRHRLRRRLRPRQTAGTGRQPGQQHACPRPLRLLLCRERADGLPARPTPGLDLVHRLARRGQVQAPGQVHPALHCRPGRRRHPRDARHVCRVSQRDDQRQSRGPECERERAERV